MLLRIALFMLWLTTNSLSTPLHKGRHHPKYINRASHKFLTKRSPSLPPLDRHAALAAQAAALRKFRNAPAILAAQGTSPGYAIPLSLQDTYDRASDYATNITFLSFQPKSFANPPSYSSSAIRVADAGTLGSENSTVTTPLTDETDDGDDLEYYGSLIFGSPAQMLQVDFDTGSTDLWVPANCSNCGQLRQFQANASSTFRNTSQPFSIAYGMGQVNGTFVTDTVKIGPLEVYNQTFGAASSVSDNFVDSPSDGIVGLAFPALAHSSNPTFLQNLFPLLAAPLFSFYLARTQARGSEVCFGCIDASKARGTTISWVPVASQNWWTVSMSGIWVNNVFVSASYYAIVDTGTSFIYLPSDVVTNIYRLIPGSEPAPYYGDGFYAYPCNSVIAVSFVLDSTKLTLDPRDMNLGGYMDDSTGSKCIGAIVSGGPSFDLVILGDSFLKSYVSIYDVSHGARVGFVESINE